MTKTELIFAVSEKMEMNKGEVEDIVNAVLDAVVKSLKKGEEVKLTGFGNFKVKERAERIGTNPADGQKITIPASKTVVFKPAKSLKESV